MNAPVERSQSESSVAARRRAALFGVLLALATLCALLGLPGGWILFCLPVIFAMPLAGPRAMALAVLVAALSAALVSGRPGAQGTSFLVGLAAFAGAGAVVGVHQRRRDDEARRMTGASFTDRLTGMRNYAFFADALARECRRAARYGTPLSLVVLDLDHFKQFNDRHGHDAGNRLLEAVGEAIRSSTRASDTAARFGGEEFALIVPGPSAEALEAAERVRRAVERIRVLVAGGERAGTTISGGVAEYVSEGDDDGRLLDRADKALYHAKSGGRNRVALFSPEHRWVAAS